MPAFLEMGAPSLMLKEGLPLKKQHTTHRERPDPFSLSLSHTHSNTKHLCYSRPLLSYFPLDREKWGFVGNQYQIKI